MKAYLEMEEIEQLEDAAQCLRDKLLIRLLARLGCRISEALALEVKDIDFARGMVTIQQSFLAEIRGKRHLTEEVIKEISSGKTYLGQEAKNLSLVDEIGGKEKALEVAAEKANITKYKVVDYTKKLERPKRWPLARLLGEF